MGAYSRAKDKSCTTIARITEVHENNVIDKLIAFSPVIFLSEAQKPCQTITGLTKQSVIIQATSTGGKQTEVAMFTNAGLGDFKGAKLFNISVSKHTHICQGVRRSCLDFQRTFYDPGGKSDSSSAPRS